MNNGFDFYRIKTTWQGEAEDQSIVKKKTEELVYASSYTEAEKVAYALVADQQRDKFSDGFGLEIIKTKMSEILCNDILQKDPNLISGLVCSYFEEGEDSGVGLYGVKVMFISIDEKTGKEKRSHEVIYTPAASNSDANQRVQKYLSSETRDFVIRDAKFDKAEAILWPAEVYEQKINAATA